MAVCIVDDPDKIRLLADFTRAEILRLLGTQPMTETQLSEQLGLTKAAIGYHLRLLMKVGVVRIEKLEAEKHGILQKYYRPAAALFIVDLEHIPKDVRRYFIQIQVEHLIGIFSVFQLYHRISKISSKALEKLAEALLEQLKEVGERYVTEEITEEDSGALKVKVYGEALTNLTKQNEWRMLFKKV